MADKTGIEWTDATWNPITGCAIVSRGCTNCYAMKLAGTRLKDHPSRYGLTQASKAGPVWTGEVRLNESWLGQPLRWKRPRKIFVCAHGDLFAENVPDEWIERVVAVAIAAWLLNGHISQILTKRPARMRDTFKRRVFWEAVNLRIADLVRGHYDPLTIDDYGPEHPCDGLWLGTSAEDQASANQRVPALLETPAAVRFVSAEPLLGPIDFRAIQPADKYHQVDALNGTFGFSRPHIAYSPRIHWIIAGGESGPGARPMHPAWAREIRDACKAAGTAFFFKQWGSWAPVSEMSDQAIDACYRPAHPTRPESTRHCLVANMVMHQDGARFRDSAIYQSGAYAAGTGAMRLMHIGKRRAGRHLDGLEHSEMPEAQP